MKDKLNNIFSDSECISEETMVAYIENKLTSQERRIVELHLASCELCSDALEGLSLVKDKDKIRKIVSDINEKITAKNLAVKPKSFWMNYRYSIAAALAFLIISGGAYIMITNNQDKDQKIFAEKFTPYPAEKAKEKDEGITTAATGEDKGPEVPDGKDVSKSNVGLAENQTRHIDDLEETDKSSLLEQLQNKPAAGQADAANRTIVVGKNDRWFNNGTIDGQYRKADSTSVQSEIAEKTLRNGDGVVNGVVTAVPMTDSVSIVSGDQVQLQQSISSQDISGYKNVDNVTLVGGTKVDKERKVKAKGTPAKVNTGIEQKESFAYNSPSGKKSENKKSESTALPAPNISTNGVVNNENLAGARGNTQSYTIDNRSSLDTAMKKYDEKDYGGAIISYEKVLDIDANNYEALFYSGVSYLSLNKPDKAIADLDKVLKKKDGQYYEAAQWYKALALIKLNDDKGAKKLLKEIISNGGTYKSQANDTFN